MNLHSRLEAAARGDLPEWARAGEGRRAHMERVVGLLDAWARALELDEEERARWRAAGFLHDAVRDASEAELRALAGEALPDLPAPVLHGPAAAARLRRDGVADGDFLDAVAWHTIGHAGLGRLGHALYVADFLEPGRRGLEDRREALRRRMPDELSRVLREVLRLRIGHQLERERPLPSETVEFWNERVDVDGPDD